MSDRITITDEPGVNVHLSDCGQPQGWDTSRPLDVHKWSDEPNVNDAVGQILEEAEKPLASLKRNRRSRYSVRQHIKVVVLDLFIAWQDNPALALGYSRDKMKYGQGSRYKKIFLKYKPMVAVCDALEALGYAEQRNGFYSHDTHHPGETTRIRSTHKLIELILKCHIEREMIYRPILEVQMKDASKNPLDVSTKATTKRLAPKVQRINEMLDSTDIVLRVTRNQYLDIINRTGLPDTTRCSVSRKFNNGSFKQGGRFYCHWVLNLPSEYRAYLTMNGEPVAELDYATLHPRMLYAEKGLIPPPGDSYELEAFPRAQGYRPIIKTLTNSLINAKSVEKAIGALFDLREMKPKLKNALRSVGMIRNIHGQASKTKQDREAARRMVKAIKEKHHAIADQFGNNRGIFLQNTDSQMAERIMLNLWSKYIPSLCVHDSFIVPAPNAVDLLREMKAAFHAEYGLDIPVTVEHCPADMKDKLEQLGGPCAPPRFANTYPTISNT